MSAGLLQGLAARALGLDAPLRSQRVRGFDGPLADEASAVDADALATTRQAAALRPPVAQASQAGAGNATRRGSAEGRAADPGGAVPPAVLDPHREETSQGRGGVQARATAQQAAPSSAQPSPPALVAPPPVSGVAESLPARAASQAASGAAVMKINTLSVQSLAPLLPLSAPSRMLPPVAQGLAALQRRREAVSAAASSAARAPTEVHVSIGRVELTALAPATSTRAPVRREAAAGHSLADYLRGPGGATGRKPA